MRGLIAIVGSVLIAGCGEAVAQHGGGSRPGGGSRAGVHRTAGPQGAVPRTGTSPGRFSAAFHAGRGAAGAGAGVDQDVDGSGPLGPFARGLLDGEEDATAPLDPATRPLDGEERLRLLRHGFGVDVPVYASLLGVSPGYYPSYHAPRSSATVTRTGADGQQTVASARSPYVETVHAAIEQLHGVPLARRHAMEGVARFQARDYLGASEHLRRAVPLDPDNGLPRFAYALSLFALGDYDGAAYNVRRGLDLLPDWAASGQDLAAQYGAAQDFEDHVQALQSHCRVQPGDLEARAMLGYVRFFSGDLDGAEAAFLAVQDARPDDPMPGHFLGEIGRIRERLAEK